MSDRLLAAVTLLAISVCQANVAALAQERPAAGKAANGGENRWGVDSEHIFGFTEGSDVGDAGEKEAEAEPVGRFGKRGGSYAATSTPLLFKYTFAENLRIASLISFSSHNISNVPGLENRDQFAFEGVGAELRYRLFDRERAPFGLTFSVLPHRNRIDPATGLPVEQYGSEFAVLFDKNVIPNQLFAGLNLLYEPQWTHSRTTGAWVRDSLVGVGAALAAQVVPGLVIATEARYLQKYEGAVPNTLLGEALFVGPSAYVMLPRQWFASAAWNVQVAGSAVGVPGSLDLTNFERHEVRVRLGANF